MKAILLASVIFFATGGNSFKITPILEWSGEESLRSEDLKNPVPMAVVQHTVTNECFTDDECEKAARSIRKYLIKIGQIDIGYNFLIGGNGKVYEGAGWNKVGAHTLGYNKESVGIGFIGTFQSRIIPFYHRTTRHRWGFNPHVVDFPTNRTQRFAASFLVRTAWEWNALPALVFPDTYNLSIFKARVNRHFLGKAPTPEALQAAQELLKYGLDNNKLSQEYKLVGARQVRLTKSPGDALQDIIEDWPHWNSVWQKL